LQKQIFNLIQKLHLIINMKGWVLESKNAIVANPIAEDILALNHKKLEEQKKVQKKLNFDQAGKRSAEISFEESLDYMLDLDIIIQNAEVKDLTYTKLLLEESRSIGNKIYLVRNLEKGYRSWKNILSEHGFIKDRKATLIKTPTLSLERMIRKNLKEMGLPPSILIETEITSSSKDHIEIHPSDTEMKDTIDNNLTVDIKEPKTDSDIIMKDSTIDTCPIVLIEPRKELKFSKSTEPNICSDCKKQQKVCTHATLVEDPS